MKKEISKTYEPGLYEDPIYEKWERSGFFNPDKQACPGKADYCIVMPPPNVTGTLHMGHAVTATLQDILIRYHRLRGDRTLWLPGTDHAAIATQTKVEKILKEEGLDRHKLGREKFLARVKRFAHESQTTIINQTKKLGASCDWGRLSYTLDETRNKAVRSVFKLMYDDGLIYRGERVVNWCPRCQSTLADDEVVYKKQTAKLYTFKYSADFPFTIATTRPETKLGDTAVAVNPKDERYKEYIGKIFSVDFVGVPLKLKIIADRNVDPAFGTGALGVTPAHSAVDWQMAEANDLPVVKVIDEDGNIHPGLAGFSGLSVSAAREIILKKLEESALLEKTEEVDNNLSVCYRCDTPVEPLPSRQWFIDVNKEIPRLKGSLKTLAIKAVREGIFGREKIRIVPERFDKNYFNWLENLRDWCISRQIWFGHRIPVWYNSKIKSPLGLARGGQKSKVIDNIYVGIEPPDGEGWEQDDDTLDTWFSSGLWTFSTLASSPEQIKIVDGRLVINSDDFRKFHPTAVLETGYDILFFWVARMIIMSIYAVGDIPFQDVYLHGLVIDEKGKKMSKSKGNVIDPLDMIARYGTDAVRFSLIIGATPGNDMRLSEEKIAGTRNLVNKIWNISRYILPNIEKGEIDFSAEKLTMAEDWILIKLQNLINEVTSDLNNYNFSAAGEKLRGFTWNDLADWYLEANKFEASVQKGKILYHLLKNLLILWHPFIPFVTEVIWGEMEEDQLLMIQKWPDIISPRIEGNFAILKEVVTAIRNARAENNIEPTKKIEAIIYAGDKLEVFKTQEVLLRCLRTGIADGGLTIKDKGEKINGAIFAAVGSIEIYLISKVDTDKEKIRLGKESSNLEKVIAGIEAKLANPEFIAKAPEKIIGQEKEKLAEYKTELHKIIAQLAELK